MAQTGVRVEGLTKVTRALRQIGLEVDDLKDAFGKIASKGAELASRFAPKRTGALAGDVRGNRAQSKAVITAGRARLPYAGPINYGWPARNIKASRFMQQADKALQPKSLRMLEQEINYQIRKRGLS